MKLFILVVATVVICTSAAPASDLQRLSPVNPDVLVAAKPEERIIMITDPQEILKFKRETKTETPFYPTVQPNDNEHRINKRSSEIKNLETSADDNETKTHNRNVESHQNQSNEQNKTLKESSKENDEKEFNAGKDETNRHSSSEAIGSPQDISPSYQKRDIPVPLVAKRPHPEESPRESSEKESHKIDHKESHEVIKSQEEGDQKESHEVKEGQSSESHVHQHNNNHPATTNGFQKIPTATLTPKETDTNAEKHKRDISKSQEESDQKESHEIKEGQSSECHLHHHNHNHAATTNGFQKIPTATLTLKETDTNAEKHKRDISKSQEESGEKESHEVKEGPSSESHLHHHNHNHAATINEFQKIPTATLTPKETDTNAEKHKRDISKSQKESDQKESHGVKGQSSEGYLPQHNNNHPTATKGFHSEELSNKHDINDLPELKPTQRTVDTTSPTQEDLKPTAQDAHLIGHDSKASSTEYSIVKPVPVSELFSRTH